MSASLDLAGRLMAGAEFSGEEVEARHRQQQHQQQHEHEHEPGVRQGGTLWANSQQQQHHHHHPRRYEGEGWREREGGKTVAGGGEAALTQRGMWSTSSVAHISGAGGGSGDDSPQGTRRALWTGSRAVGDDNA
jgi:ABC-type Zn2+ transport system substrate-binding protein/surface adhesin